MNWLRDRIRKWLALPEVEAMVWQHHSDLAKLEATTIRLRLDVDEIKTSPKKLQPARPRIYDFESATQEALSEFKEEKNVISRN